MTFAPGNVVKLKSTGPDMTVEEADKGRCWCVWFDGDEVKRDSFVSDCLQGVKPIPSRNPMGLRR